MDLHDKMHKAKLKAKDNGLVKFELKNEKIHFNSLRHDKLDDRSMCTVNIGVEEVPTKFRFISRIKFHIKQAKQGIATDGPACWKGIDLTADLIMTRDEMREQMDDKFLTNAAKISGIIPPELWKESLLGDWKLTEKNPDKTASTYKFWHLAGEEKKQARLMLRLIDFESVGREKGIMSLPTMHPEHAERVLDDPIDKTGPKF